MKFSTPHRLRYGVFGSISRRGVCVHRWLYDGPTLVITNPVRWKR